MAVDSIILPIIFAIVLALLSQYSDHVRLRKIISKHGLMAFAAGLSIAYLFLTLLPQSLEIQPELRRTLFMFMLVGFAVFRLGEVYAYRHATGRKRRRELKLEHNIAFAIYHFIIGISLVFFLEQSLRQGILFFVPIAVHIAATTAAFSRLHGKRTRQAPHLLASVAPILGVVVALYVVLSQQVLVGIVGVVIGALFYLVIKELLPSRGRGDPKWFVIGIILFVLIEFVLRSMVA